jgi:hypothetical protein
MEQKGKGAANATVTSWMEPGDDGTHVFMEADITLTGAAAQLSRGLLPEVSKRLTAQFAECLRATLEANEGAAEPDDATPAPAPIAAKPVGGIGLGLAAMWSSIVNFFKRLFGGSEDKASS